MGKAEKVISTVKFFNNEKGWGFALHPEGKEDIFLHYTQIINENGFRSLDLGQTIGFDIIVTDKGLFAKNIYKV